MLKSSRRSKFCCIHVISAWPATTDCYLVWPPPKNAPKQVTEKAYTDGSYALRCDVWVVCACIAECIAACFIGFWGRVFGGSASLHD